MAWVKPSNGFLKINVKGVFNRSQRKAAVGCIIRDHRGQWVKGSGGNIGLAPPITAELWALFYGLKMAWEMNTQPKKYILETDAADALNVVLYPNPSFPHAELVQWINDLLHEKWDTLEVVLVEDSANGAAAAFATHNLNGSSGVDDFDRAPTAIRAVVSNEA